MHIPSAISFPCAIALFLSGCGSSPPPLPESPGSAQMGRASLASRERERLDFESAQRTNTVDALAGFLRDHPNGDFADRAKTQIETLQFQQAQATASEPDLERFAQHPGGVYAEQARKQIEKIVGYYECRWLIEEFHNAWKTGCRIEQRPFQSLENLERMMAVTAPIAERPLQIQALAKSRPTESCAAIVSAAQHSGNVLSRRWIPTIRFRNARQR